MCLILDSRLAPEALVIDGAAAVLQTSFPVILHAGSRSPGVPLRWSHMHSFI